MICRLDSIIYWKTKSIKRNPSINEWKLKKTDVGRSVESGYLLTCNKCLEVSTHSLGLQKLQKKTCIKYSTHLAIMENASRFKCILLVLTKKLMRVIFEHIVLLYSSDVVMKTQKFYSYYKIPGIYIHKCCKCVTNNK